MVYVKVAFCLFDNMYGVCEGGILFILQYVWCMRRWHFVYLTICMVYAKVAFCLFDNMYGVCEGGLTYPAQEYIKR